MDDNKKHSICYYRVWVENFKWIFYSIFLYFDYYRNQSPKSESIIFYQIFYCKSLLKSIPANIMHLY